MVWQSGERSSLCCTDMSHRSRSRFDRLLPVSDRYASLPVADAFIGPTCADQVDPGEWYMVAFRSRPPSRRGRGSPDRLRRLGAPRGDEGRRLRPLLQGPDPADGRCMSFCLWDSRAEARAAAGRPAHTQAAALTHEAYQSTPSNSTECAGLRAGLHVRAVRRAGRAARARAVPERPARPVAAARLTAVRRP